MDKRKLILERKLDYAEIEAYRDLDGQPIDFGTGLIENDCKDSEDAVWKFQQQVIECELFDLLAKEESRKSFKKTTRDVRRHQAIREKQRLKREHDYNYFIFEPNDYWGRYHYGRWYMSGRKSFAKFQTNRKIRNGFMDFKHKGKGYGRAFDYFYTVF